MHLPVDAAPLYALSDFRRRSGSTRAADERFSRRVRHFSVQLAPTPTGCSFATLAQRGNSDRWRARPRWLEGPSRGHPPRQERARSSAPLEELARGSPRAPRACKTGSAPPFDGENSGRRPRQTRSSASLIVAIAAHLGWHRACSPKVPHMRVLWTKAGKLLPVDTGGKIRSYNC